MEAIDPPAGVWIIWINMAHGKTLLNDRCTVHHQMADESLMNMLGQVSRGLSSMCLFAHAWSGDKKCAAAFCLPRFCWQVDAFPSDLNNRYISSQLTHLHFLV